MRKREAAEPELPPELWPEPAAEPAAEPPLDIMDPASRAILVDRAVAKMLAEPEYQLRVLAEVWVILAGLEAAMVEFQKLGPGGLLKLMTGKKK